MSGTSEKDLSEAAAQLVEKTKARTKEVAARMREIRIALIPVSPSDKHTDSAEIVIPSESLPVNDHTDAVKLVRLFLFEDVDSTSKLTILHFGKVSSEPDGETSEEITINLKQNGETDKELTVNYKDGSVNVSAGFTREPPAGHILKQHTDDINNPKVVQETALWNIALAEDIVSLVHELEMKELQRLGQTYFPRLIAIVES